MPRDRIASAKSQKTSAVRTMQPASVGQKPKRGSSIGKSRNIGSVGTTYQNVSQAWLASFCWGCCSRCSHTSVRIVTSGSAAISAPSLSLRLAASETTTTSAAVVRYLKTSQPIAPLYSIAKTRLGPGASPARAPAVSPWSFSRSDQSLTRHTPKLLTALSTENGDNFVPCFSAQGLSAGSAACTRAIGRDRMGPWEE